MSDYKVTDSELTGIANAIRTKGGTSSPLVFPNGFTSAIGAIPTGSGVIQPLSVNSNGTYTPPSGVDGYAPVTVNVSGGGGGPYVINIQPTIKTASYISSQSTIWLNDNNYPNYALFILDLQSFPNITITVRNNGNRNYYGFTNSEPYDGIHLLSSRIDSGGVLTINTNSAEGRYLVYDFTSDYPNFDTSGLTVTYTINNSNLFVPIYHRFIDGSYVGASESYAFTYASSGTNALMDAYRVSAHRQYVAVPGFRHGNRFRVAFIDSDPVALTANYSGSIYRLDTPIAEYGYNGSFGGMAMSAFIFPDQDGYLLVHSTAEGEYFLRSYLLDITDTMSGLYDNPLP